MLTFLNLLFDYFLWKFLIRPMGGAWDIYELLPAFLVSAAVIFIVSLLTDPPEQNVTEVFDA
jgi:sodium/proline symporter